MKNLIYIKMRLRQRHIALGVLLCLMAVVLSIYYRDIVFGTVAMFLLGLISMGAEYLFLKKAGSKRPIRQKIFLSGVALWLVSFLVVEGLILRDMNDTVAVDTEYAIVLGAAVRDGKPSDMLRFRLDRAVAYLEEMPTRYVIVSGGKGPLESEPEAEVMKRYLVGQGIAPNRILKEDRSTTTDENLRFSKEVVKARHGKDLTEIAIVSNDYHLYRAKRIAAQYYGEVYGLAAETPLQGQVVYLPREYFALVKSYFSGASGN